MILVYSQKKGETWFATAIENHKVLATAFAASEKEALRTALETLPYKEPFQTEEKTSPLAQKVFDAMHSVLSGKDVNIDFEFDYSHVSKYAQKVLRCLEKVPVGYVTTYKALANTTRGGPRAVGQIMALNPFAPIIACHRVVKSDFSMGGYGGGFGEGVKTKRAILQREDRGYEKPSKIKTECGMLELFPVRFLK